MLLKRQQFVPEHNGRSFESLHAIAQLRHQQRLAKGVSFLESIFLAIRCYPGKTFSTPGVIVDPVALNDVGQDTVYQAGRLHGAQALVVNADRTRLAPGIGLALDHQGPDTL